MSIANVTSLRPRKDTGESLTTGASSVRTADGCTSTDYRLYTDQDCWIAFGDSAVEATANDMFLPSGAIEYFPVGLGTYVAVLQVTTTGTLRVIDVTR